MPLGAKPVNRQLVLSKSTSSPTKEHENAPSPFTALPPKLGLKMRIRAKMSPKKKTVDVGFLGTTVVTKRRKDQFDAARRKLEGTGTPEEQISDGESDGDNSGILEASGEGGLFSFARYVPSSARLSLCFSF
jgi:hypothetical protein